MGPAVLVAVVASAVASSTAVAYRTGPPAAHTGAFGEPHCGECHFDAEVDDPAGRLRLDAPDRYTAGETYSLTVEVTHPELKIGGFELTTRFVDGDARGEQAGTLAGPEDRTRSVTGKNGVVYVTHILEGTQPVQPSVARWTLQWTAPPADGVVAVDVAANAANDDDSEFGDRIYLARVRIPPADPARPRHVGHGSPVRETQPPGVLASTMSPYPLMLPAPHALRSAGIR